MGLFPRKQSIRARQLLNSSVIVCFYEGHQIVNPKTVTDRLKYSGQTAHKFWTSVTKVIIFKNICKKLFLGVFKRV